MNSLHLFSIKPSSSLKLKTIFQTLIFPHLHRIARPAATKAKSLILKLLRDTTHLAKFQPLKKMKKQCSRRKNNKLFFGSFRLHYNWCSSHVMPLGHRDIIKNNNMQVTTADDGDDRLWRYLEWLEDTKPCTVHEELNEIDKLADLFIANCHEMFRLEKQESYRRFQEMMARSV